MDMILGSYPSWSLLIVRVVLGIIFFAHGGLAQVKSMATCASQ